MDVSAVRSAGEALELVFGALSVSDVGSLRSAIHSTEVPGLLSPVAALWCSELLDEVLGRDRSLASVTALAVELVSDVDASSRVVLDVSTLSGFLVAPEKFASSFGYPLLLVWAALRRRFPEARSAAAPAILFVPDDSPQFLLLLDAAAAQGAASIRGHLSAEISVGLVSPFPPVLALQFAARDALESACAAAVEGDLPLFEERLAQLSALPFGGAEFAGAVVARALQLFVADPVLERISSVASRVTARFPRGTSRPLVELSLLAAALSNSTLVPSVHLPSSRLLVLSLAALCEERAQVRGAPGRIWGAAAATAFSELLPRQRAVRPRAVRSEDVMPAFGAPVGFVGERMVFEVFAASVYAAEVFEMTAPFVLLLVSLPAGFSASWVRPLGVVEGLPVFASSAGTEFVLSGRDGLSSPPRVPLEPGEVSAALESFGGLPPLP